MFLEVFKKNFSIITIFILIIIFVFNLKVILKIFIVTPIDLMILFLEDKEHLSEDQNYLVENMKLYWKIIIAFNYSLMTQSTLLLKTNCTKYYFIF